MSKPTCRARHPETGVRCGLPQGHRVQHSNGSLTRTWSDPPEHFLGGAGFSLASEPIFEYVDPIEIEMLYGKMLYSRLPGVEG